jgi:glycosyltransferase involved in cell wall biosynthesis
VADMTWEVGDPAPSPLPACCESDVTATWDADRPVVSVMCRTHQHVDFIEDAIRGFLGQRTTFPFEVWIRDDASTDGTAEIVDDYATRFPNVVRALLEPANRWKDPDRRRFRSYADGEFIAPCEGDDYWIDPRKLEKQVSTLRRRSDVVLSHHQSMVIEDGIIRSLAKLPPHGARDLSAQELRRAMLALGHTILHRNVPLERHPMRDQVVNGDLFTLSLLGRHGGAAWEESLLPAVYRRHPGGVSSGASPEQRSMDAVRSHYWIGWYHARRDEPELAAHFLGRGLAWYTEGARALGIESAELLRRNDRLVRRVVQRPSDGQPESIRRLVAQRDRAREDRDRATAAARGRGDPHHAGGGRPVRATR